jgi:hypothetical protein
VIGYWLVAAECQQTTNNKPGDRLYIVAKATENPVSWFDRANCKL